MKIKPAYLVVGAVAAATIAFLWHEHASKATPGTAAAGGPTPLGTSPVPTPKPRRRVTASTAKVDPLVPEEPYTQLQYESAAALGFSSVETTPADDAPSRALKEDLAYLGLGDAP